ncbi:MAG: hypothetical protein Q7R30_18155 [Acidobacteriota bacterium]|nr:hypothetical protein [Acidobacteriota bacterium]
MRRRLSVALTLALGVGASAQQLPSEPVRQFGQSVTPSYEGWFTNPDGSHSFLVGYLNRNSKEAVDVPIGPNNRIEPGGPDMGQPTHFLPGRQTGVFLITVPKEFTPQQRLTWTIVANGQQMSIPLRLNELYEVRPFADAAVGNKPPVLRFDPNGPAMQGPIGMVAKAIARTATMAAGIALPIWATDDAKYSSGSNAPQRNPPPPVILHWSKYRGPGEVTFDKDPPPFEKLPGEAAFSGKATVTAKFSQPGEYLLHVSAEDYSGDGGGGEVCCWTTTIVRVTVTP